MFKKFETFLNVLKKPFIGYVNARESIKGTLYLISLQTLWEVVSKV